MAVTEKDLETLNLLTSLLSFALLLSARKYKKLWAVGNIPWVFLPLSFALFSMREFMDITSPASIMFFKPLLGIWSAFFFSCTFGYLLLTLFFRLKLGKGVEYVPFAFSVMPVFILSLLLYSGFGLAEATKVLNVMETAIWISLGLTAAIFAYLIGSRATGGFSRVYLLFQFAAYSTVTWKILDIASLSYSEEYFEMLFGLFSALAVFELRRMLIKLHAQLG